MYEPYVVPHYPHIPSLGYLHRQSSTLPSSMLPDHYPKNISEHTGNRRDRRSNENKKEKRYVMRRREGENQDLVSVSIDLSHEYQVQQK